LSINTISQEHAASALVFSRFSSIHDAAAIIINMIVDGKQTFNDINFSPRCCQCCSFSVLRSEVDGRKLKVATWKLMKITAEDDDNRFSN
jgi:hypothetical protein